MIIEVQEVSTSLGTQYKATLREGNGGRGVYAGTAQAAVNRVKEIYPHAKDAEVKILNKHKALKKI